MALGVAPSGRCVIAGVAAATRLLCPQVMFGFAVGLLTEYATGVDFIEQFGQIVTYLGIADLE